jgi:hypothetical protein
MRLSAIGNTFEGRLTANQKIFRLTRTERQL